MEHDNQAWVEVRHCRWLHEAQLIKSVLEGADIEAFVPDEHTLGVAEVAAEADHFRPAP